MIEHPFAHYVRTLGRGKRGARPLTRDEAHDAMRMILAGEVEPVQLGAFLMLMRIKEESPEELAGFVTAARASLRLDAGLPSATLDWSSYAGKRRQLPWFILSALLLAQNGIRVLMHGTRSHRDDRIYIPDVVTALGLPHCRDLTEVGAELDRCNFAYIDLAQLSPRLHEILNLRPLFGLRSPINSLLRMINPLSAPYMLQGIFHPGYLQIHHRAAQLLGEHDVAVFKGEAGEIERNPDLPCEVLGLRAGMPVEEAWPAMFTRRHLKDEQMDTGELIAVWQGRRDHEYGVAAVTGTTAIALRLLGRAASPAAAEALASDLWLNRISR